MKERPILFSGPMVRAILDEKKTQTRRIVRDVATCDRTGVAYWPGMKHGGGFLSADHCPYGKPGDRLWVRETWHPLGPWEASTATIEYRADGGRRESKDHLRTFKMTSKDVAGCWRSPRLMPRWASRIDLAITGVRVERLQDITEADILAEGVTVDVAAKMTGIPWSSLPTLHDGWREGWNMINGERASWESNPWVWVIEFKRIEPRGETKAA